MASQHFLNIHELYMAYARPVQYIKHMHAMTHITRTIDPLLFSMCHVKYWMTKSCNFEVICNWKLFAILCILTCLRFIYGLDTFLDWLNFTIHIGHNINNQNSMEFSMKVYSTKSNGPSISNLNSNKIFTWNLLPLWSMDGWKNLWLKIILNQNLLKTVRKLIAIISQLSITIVQRFLFLFI